MSVADVRKDEPRTAVEMWRHRIEASGDRPGWRRKVGATWETWTWKQADAAAREIGGGLAALGIEPGDRVAILSQSRLEWMLCDVGILMAAGVTVPIYASSTPEQCEFILRDCGAKLVVCEDAAQAAKIHGRLPALTVVQMDGPADRTLEALRAEGRTWNAAYPGELDKREDGLAPETTFTIIYTSGTTGNPKGVVLTHENLCAAICSAVRALTLFETDVQLLFLPCAHVLARELEWAPMRAGFVTAFAENIGKIKDNLVEIRPTFMAGVPRIFEKFYGAVQSGARQGSGLKRALVSWSFTQGRRASQARAAGKPAGGIGFAVADALVLRKLRARLGLDRCRFLISGGAPLAAEIAEFFDSVGLPILEGYGLTETVAAAFLNRLDRYRFGTVGPALDVVECRLADDGEILMRGPSVFRQYYNNPEATAESVEPDGWFHSGDIGQLEDGFLRITDRKKDLIVTAGGKKVAPQPLENALKARSALVGHVLVYGDKRPYCVALLTLSDEAIQRFGGSHEALAKAPEVRAALQKDIDALNATLASYESVKRFAILPKDLTEAEGEMTASLKIKRKVVIEKFKDTIEELYR